MESLTAKIITNLLSKRCLGILNLLEGKEEIQTREIAESLNSSKRTILADLNELRDYFGSAITISGSNRGIKLTVNDYTIYHEKKKKYVQQEPLVQIIAGIYSGEYLSISEWAEKVNFSESTVLRLLKKLDRIIQNYRLGVIRSPVKFSGRELDIRKFFWDLYYESTFIEINEVEGCHQAALTQLILADDRFVSIKRVRSILNLSFKRIGMGEIEFLPKIVENVKVDRLIAPLFLEIRKITYLKKYSDAVIYREVVFIFLMLYSHWNQRKLTGIRLLEFSSTSKDFSRSLVKFLLDGRTKEDRGKVELAVQDFLSRQYTKICLGETYLKNTEDNNRFAKSLNPRLHNELCTYLINHTALPSHFQNTFISDFSSSFLLYLFANQFIFTPINVLILLENDSIIDEPTKIIFEKFFSTQATILYEEEIGISDIKKDQYSKIITNIIPFEHEVTDNAEVIHFSKSFSVEDIIRLVSSLQDKQKIG
ncbi:helix-turn-helix domain-containing protein [Enterococcus sp. AZ196]|uniref:helix-turn-helix domain-containing protein n=1 Tax=Enterococcus sp. AZ196 TaxID=2774659 RepID=UPI003D29F41F